MIQQLTLSLAGVKHEQEYMQVRDRVHRSSKFILLLWNFVGIKFHGFVMVINWKGLS